MSARKNEETLVVTVEVAARPRSVFGFFTDGAAFDRWMGADLGKASIDPRPGGEIRVEFAGGERVARGEVLALDPPGRFAFTWGYEGDEALPPGASTVEIELEPLATGTRVVLRHSGLPTRELLEGHRSGFRLYLSRLAYFSARAEHGARLEATVAAWFAAWNADDPAERERALATCLAEGGAFQDAYAAFEGRSALAAHIAQSRAFMHGVRLSPGDEPELVHGHVRFDWRAVRGEEIVATGSNVGTLDLDGRFVRVVGFRDQG